MYYCPRSPKSPYLKRFRLQKLSLGNFGLVGASFYRWGDWSSEKRGGCQNLTTNEGPSWAVNPGILPSPLVLLLDLGFGMSALKLTGRWGKSVLIFLLWFYSEISAVALKYYFFWCVGRKCLPPILRATEGWTYWASLVLSRAPGELFVWNVIKVPLYQTWRKRQCWEHFRVSAGGLVYPRPPTNQQGETRLLLWAFVFLKLPRIHCLCPEGVYDQIAETKHLINQLVTSLKAWPLPSHFLWASVHLASFWIYVPYLWFD